MTQPSSHRHYRIVRIAALHNARAGVYNAEPTLASQSYVEQQARIFNSGSGTSDWFARGFQEMGHDAHEILYDVDVLQKRWAEEIGAAFNPAHWQEEILRAQLKHLKPEVIYFCDTDCMSAHARRALFEEIPSLRQMVVQKETPTRFHEVFPSDIVLATCEQIAKRCSETGLSPDIVYHGFDTTVLERLGPKKDLHHDVTFVGKSGYGFATDYIERYWSLVELAKNSDLQLWLDEQNGVKDGETLASKKQIASLLATHSPAQVEELCMASVGDADANVQNLLKGLIEEVSLQQRLISDIYYRWSPQGPQLEPLQPLTQAFPTRCHNPQYGNGMYEVLQHSRITFNRHANTFRESVGNKRLFEATGVGACLLTDSGSDLANLFEADREVVTYASIEECLEKTSYLLNNEHERARIAAAGQQRCINQHSTQQRCHEIDALIQKRLANSSPVKQHVTSSLAQQQREPIQYILPQIDRIGQLTSEVFLLRNIFPENKYDVTLITFPPEMRPRTNAAVYELITRGLNVQHSMDENLIWSTHRAKQAGCNSDDVLSTWTLRKKFIQQRNSGEPLSYWFAFSAEDIERGERLRAGLGIPNDAPIVTVHVREGGYLPELGYHSFRDADIDNYIPAIKWLTDSGFYVVRVGDNSMKPLALKHPQVIDAPFHPAYNDFFDLYFVGCSTFLFGMTSGPYDIARGFGVPILAANAPLQATNYQLEDDMILPKHYFSHRSGSVMNFRDILSSGAGSYYRNEQYIDSGIELRENSAEELLAAAQEMLAGIRGEYQSIDLQRRARRRTWELAQKHYDVSRDEYEYNWFQEVPFSVEFLKKHPNYLD